MKTKLNLWENSSKLDKRVFNILKSMLKNHNSLDDLYDEVTNGCSSGCINELIYYKQTLQWYKKYLPEINELIKQNLADTGLKSLSDIFGNNFDKNDPLCNGTNNKNLLSWYSFEVVSFGIFNYNNII